MMCAFALSVLLYESFHAFDVKNTGTSYWQADTEA